MDIRNQQIYDDNLQPDSQPNLDGTTAGQGNHWPLAPDKQYFHCVLSKSHLIHHLFIPTKMHNILPKTVVPAILTCKNSYWNMRYCGDRPRIDGGWKMFVKDNKLKVGDGCVFELMECNTDVIKFRVQILDGDIPSEFLDRIDGNHIKVALDSLVPKHR